MQPIFKDKGDISTPTSYRPVSICATLGKVLERLIIEKILEFSLSNNLISRHQNGFIPNRSTLTNLLELDSILANWDNKNQPYDIISFDFSRAFDKVPHALLRGTIAATIPIHQESLCWLHSYLFGRSQRIRLGNNFSEMRHVSSGVIQGLCLGPILFNIYSNPLLNKLKGVASAYADDIKYAGNTVISTKEQIQQDLNIIDDWSEAMLTPLSIVKYLVLHCRINNPQWAYTCSNCPLPVTDDMRDLGVSRTKAQEFSINVALVASKAYRSSGVLLLSFRYRDN